MKDGRIVEQGTHSELLALGGNFATMWADQVSSTDEAVSAHRKSAVVTGFDVEDVPAQDPVVIAEDLEAVPQVGTEEVAQDALADGEPAVESAPEVVADEATAPVAFPSTDSAEDAVEAAPESSAEPVPEASAAAPVAFPTSANDTAPVSFPSSDAAPLAFPTSDSPVPVAFPGSPDTASQREGSVAERAQNPGVTFQEAHTPSRTGTPDPEADGKRRRTLSTQGIQRLARRISITTRRQGSGSGSSIPAIAGSFIPGLKRAETANSNKDEGSSSKDTPKDSPSASVSSDIGKAKLTKSKKEKKLEKRKTMS